MLSYVSHNKKFPKTFRHIQSDCMVIKMTTCGIFSVYLNLYHPCSLIYVKDMWKKRQRSYPNTSFLFFSLSSSKTMASSRWSSWWGWCGVSQPGWNISLKWTTFTVTWLHETFSSTATWCVKCLTLACHATYKMTPLIPAIPAPSWVHTFLFCLSAIGNMSSFT